jgi:hypothetical protein
MIFVNRAEKAFGYSNFKEQILLNVYRGKVEIMSIILRIIVARIIWEVKVIAWYRIEPVAGRLQTFRLLHATQKLNKQCIEQLLCMIARTIVP